MDDERNEPTLTEGRYRQLWAILRDVGDKRFQGEPDPFDYFREPGGTMAAPAEVLHYWCEHAGDTPRTVSEFLAGAEASESANALDLLTSAGFPYGVAADVAELEAAGGLSEALGDVGRAWVDGFTGRGSGLWVGGPRRAGRTATLAALALALMRRWESGEGGAVGVRYVTGYTLASDVASALRFGGNGSKPTKAEVMTEYAGHGLLMLDGLGDEDPGGFDAMLHVLEGREAERRPTVLASALRFREWTGRFRGSVGGEQVARLEEAALALLGGREAAASHHLHVG